MRSIFRFRAVDLWYEHENENEREKGQAPSLCLQGFSTAAYLQRASAFARSNLEPYTLRAYTLTSDSWAVSAGWDSHAQGVVPCSAASRLCTVKA